MKNIFFKVVLFFIVFGCSKSDDSDSTSLNNISTDATSITIFSSVTQTTAGNSVVFSVIDNKNIDRTSSSKIFVNGNQISSSSHVFNDIGSHEVYAQYLNLTSQKLTIEIEQEPIKFKKRVLLEDYTATWCQYCPRVSYAIEQLLKQTQDVVVIAIHGSSDPFRYEGLSTVLNAFGISGYPTAIVDRNTEVVSGQKRFMRWKYPEVNNSAQIINLTEEDATVGITITSSLSGSTLTVKVKFKMGKNFDALDLSLHLLEDNLIYNQTNSTSYYGGGNPLVNFVHDNVLRKSLSSILGDQIPDDNLSRESVYEKDFQFTLPSSYKVNNLKLVAIASNSNTGKSYNARSSAIGESQSFEQIN